MVLCCSPIDLLYPELTAHPEAKPLPNGPLVPTVGNGPKDAPANKLGRHGNDLISGKSNVVSLPLSISHAIYLYTNRQ